MFVLWILLWILLWATPMLSWAIIGREIRATPAARKSLISIETLVMIQKYCIIFGFIAFFGPIVFGFILFEVFKVGQKY